MKRWDCNRNENAEDAAVDAFLIELVEVCRRHRMTLGHEDDHGAFEVRSFDEANIKWMLDAQIAIDESRLQAILDETEETP